MVTTNSNFTDPIIDFTQSTFTNDLLFCPHRFGNLRNGTQDLKNHKWFKDIDFLALYNKQIDPPFKPSVKSPGDTSHFDPFDEEPLRISEHDLYKEDFEKF